jgi:hypothetical protein
MNPIAIAIAGVLLVVGIVIGKTSHNSTEEFQSSEEGIEVSQTPTPSIDDSVTPSATMTMSPTSIIKVTSTSTPVPTSQPTSISSTKTEHVSLNAFRYPNATDTSFSDTSLSMTSTDSPESITNWYEQAIKNNGFNSRASAKTNSNGNIENKLGGGKNGESVNITIKKSAGSNEINITVTKEPGSGNTSIQIHNSTTSQSY